MKLFRRLQLFAIPWTVAYQAPPSMEFSRQEYWSGLPFPSPGDLPDPGIEPRSPTLQADALPSELPGKPSGNHSAHENTVDFPRSTDGEDHVHRQSRVHLCLAPEGVLVLAQEHRYLYFSGNPKRLKENAGLTWSSSVCPCCLSPLEKGRHHLYLNSQHSLRTW